MKLLRSKAIQTRYLLEFSRAVEGRMKDSCWPPALLRRTAWHPRTLLVGTSPGGCWETPPLEEGCVGGGCGWRCGSQRELDRWAFQELWSQHSQTSMSLFDIGLFLLQRGLWPKQQHHLYLPVRPARLPHTSVLANHDVSAQRLRSG